MKKILSFVLVFVFVIGICASAPITITANAAAKMTVDQLRSKFKENKYWNGGNPDSYTSTPCNHHGSCSYDGSCGCNTFKNLSIQCMGYAEKLGYDFTGYNPRNNSNGWNTYTSSSSLSSLKAGDIVRFKNGSNEHSIFVIGVSGDTVTYTDCNSDGHCIIKWDETITKTKLKNNFIHLRSAPYEITSLHTLYVKYNANGGIIAGSDKTYDKYKVATSAGLNMRSGAGSDYDRLAILPTGTTFAVVATKKADGYTWGQTSYSSYTGWVVISEDWVTKIGTQPQTKYYLTSDGMVYTSSSGSVKVQKMVEGEVHPDGLYNYTTFGISRNGYKFVGWSGSASGGTVYSQSGAMTAADLYPNISLTDKTITLYAIWELEHTCNYSEITITTSPTCTNTGVKTFKCSCGKSYTETIAATGHKTELQRQSAPTCENTGFSGDEVCTVCGEIVKKGTYTASLGHAFDSGVLKLESTCEKKGYREYTCTRCGEIKGESLAPIGHKIVKIPEVAATCYDTGLSEGEKCETCGVIISEQKEIAKLEHEKTIVKKNEVTCEQDGYTGDVYCVLCNTILKKGETIPATGHLFSSTPTSTKNPTCVTTGLNIYTCVVCGGTKTESIPVVAHIKSEWIVDKEATVKEAGSKHIECTVCKKVLETASIESLPLLAPTVKATNVANGINVNWNSVDGAEKYIVYRKTYNDSTKVWGGWETLTSNCTATSYVDTKAMIGVKYIYTAVAVAGDVKSSFVATSALLRDVAPTVKVANATSGVTVTWNSVYGAQKYIVYRKTYNDTTKAWSSWESLTGSCTTTSYTDSKALLGVKYMYTVRATRNGVSGSFVASDTLQRDVAPVVKVANATSGVTVTWNSVYGAQKYSVYRKTYNDTTKAWSSWESLTGSCTTTSYTDTKALIGVKYMYTVVAVRNGVNSSFVASGTLQRDVAPVVKVANATSGVTVTWNSVYGAQKYTVYRKTYNDTTKAWGSWEVLANNCTATTYNDAKALLGVKYMYTVRAVRNSVSGSFVASKEIQRNVTPTVKIANATNGVTVTWNSVYGAQKYIVYRKTYNDTTKAWSGWEALTTNCTATTYTDTKALLGVKYIYTVVAVRNGVNSSFVATGELQRNVAPAVTIAKQSNGIKVNWSSVYGAQKYTVYRKTYNATTKTWSSWEVVKSGCTTTSYTDTSAKNGTYYRYTVCGVRNNFQSNFVQSSVLQYVK